MPYCAVAVLDSTIPWDASCSAGELDQEIAPISGQLAWLAEYPSCAHDDLLAVAMSAALDAQLPPAYSPAPVTHVAARAKRMSSADVLVVA